MLTNNQAMVLNDIIYKIHTMEDFDEMRISILRSLEFIIPAPLFTFYLSDSKERSHLVDPVGLADGKVLDIEKPKSAPRMNTTEPLDIALAQYSDEFEEIDYTRWIFFTPYAKVYRESDLMSEEERVQTEYYQRMFLPAKLHYTVILVLNYGGTFYGCITLFRAKEEGDFTDEEMFMLDILKDHLSYRAALHCELPVVKQEDISDSSDKELDKVLFDYGLTRRETEIVHLLLAGTSREEICEQLFIAPNTLKKHVLHIYKKLNVKSWRELFCMLKQ